MDFLTANDYSLARVIFERSMAALYLVAFASALNQFPALLGEKGLLPTPRYLEGRTFRYCPTLFHWRYTDRYFRFVAWVGILLSASILVGALAMAPIGLGLVTWLVLFFLYLSIVNVGQTFYSFGWESMILETGFFTAFLSPQWMDTSWLSILLLRWMLFRVELGAGLIKLRAGGAWRDFTALDYHHETQPMPNPLSRLVHRLPRRALRGGVALNHFVQVVVPFGIFFPQPVAGICGALIIAHQLILIAAGNYAWLNWLTVALAFLTIPDAWWVAIPGLADGQTFAARPLAWEVALLGLFAATVFLSVKPTKNLCSKHQRMNECYNVWHLVNSYGAFGGVTRERYEIVLEGTDADNPYEAEEWREYEFKGKPGALDRIPPQVAPYHLRLDWLMWFLPFSVRVTDRGISTIGREDWFMRFVERLLRGDEESLKLLRANPFPEAPPKLVRALYYKYQFTTKAEKRATGNVWKRELVGEYLRPVNLKQLDWV